MNYFDRICAIEMSPDILVTDFEIAFEVKKSIQSDSNFCKVEVYNMPIDTRNRITTDIDSLLRVKAGYTQNTGLVEIGQGNISYVSHANRRPDIVTTIFAKDGLTATRNKYITLSFAENITLDKIITAIAEKMQLPARYDDYDKTQILKGGYSYQGAIPTVLDELGFQFGFAWSIQNGQLMIINRFRGTTNMSIFLSPATGLLESPDDVILTEDLKKLNKNEYKVSSLLQPQLEVGDLIQIESNTLNGVFLVNELSHQGNNRMGDWKTDMIVIKNE